MVPHIRQTNVDYDHPPQQLSKDNENRRFSYGFYYLDEEARRNLPHYQYKGCDQSLLYKYILSPLATVCVETFVPRTMAPNTVTLLGLAFMICSYSIFWYYVPTLEIDPEAPPPRWIFLFHAIAMLVYQTLDNMDGKQARRTNSSSPLGLLFDHGCDAINSIFGSANWIISMGLIPSQELGWCWTIIMGPFAMFYIATWEQYYTGELIMPLINGPNEGLFLGAMLSLTSFVWGYEFWLGTLWWDTILECMPGLLQYLPTMAAPYTPLRNCDLVLLAASFGFCQEILLKTWSVTRAYGITTLQTMVPMACLAWGYAIIGWMDPTIFLNVPRVTLNLAMILFVEMSVQMMLSHITAKPFWPWRWQLIPLVGLTVAVYCEWFDSNHRRHHHHQHDRHHDHHRTMVTSDQYVLAYTWSMFAYLCMKIVLVINEICTVLNIWCFDIVTPRQKRRSQSGFLVSDNHDRIASKQQHSAMSGHSKQE